MKILVVCSYYPPHLGGLEIVAQQHAERLAKRGHVVTVLTSMVDTAEVSGIVNGVSVVRLATNNFFENRFGVPFPLFSFRFLGQAFREVRSVDVVHVHDVFYLSSFLAALAAHWYKKPLVLMQHVEIIAHPSRLVMFIQKVVFATTGAYIFKRSKKILTLNNRVDDFLLRRGILVDKIVAIANGVDSEKFKPVFPLRKADLKKKFGLDTNKNAVLFVGRFVPKKGFEKLIAAKDSKYQIVFAGGQGPHESNSELIFLGKLSQDQLAEVYQAADIFALPSEGEGFPLSVQEAMSAGLPIITTNDYGYGRYKFDTRNIILLDDLSPEHIKDIISTLVSDNNRMMAMSEYSRQYATTNFDWDVIITSLEELYNKVV